MTDTPTINIMETNANFLDARTMKLIAIGASVAAHCQPCLAYHVGAARDLGMTEALIREAITVGHRVEKGAIAAMRKFSDNVHELPVAAVPPPAPACCGNTTTKNGTMKIMKGMKSGVH
ncbi:MAG: carboxymuconolactone decarboxylase family protein [bacterium]